MKDTKRLLQETREYRRSLKNIEYCKPFMEIRDELVEIVKPFQNQFQPLLQECERDVAYYQYASGGAMIHRGFYCPSPVLDIYTNAKRGRLLNETKSKAKRSFKYGFDKYNRMRVVYRKEQNGTIEVVQNEESKELGLSFSSEGLLEAFSICTYQDECITRYINGIYRYWDESIHEFIDERYFYSQEGLYCAEIYQFFSKKYPVVMHQDLLFEHNEEGYLEKYTFIEYKYDEKVREVQHDVDVIRKV